MARTRKKLIFKAGPLELSKRIQLTEKRTPAKAAPVQLATQEPKKPRMKNGQGVVIGVTGNTGYYGYPDTGEYLTKLDGFAGRTIYDEMRRSDAQVQATLRAITLPIRRAIYNIESASDDSKDVEIAEILEKRLLYDMTMTWDDTLRHALLMLPFGFSILEKVWEIADGFIMPRKLDPRLPQSVTGWKYNKEKRRLVGPTQVDTDGNIIELPIEKILVFTSDKEGDNWEGIPILRSAYKPWYIKSDLEKINAIKHDRHGVGVPDITVPPGINPGSAEWEAAEDLGESIRAMEKGYIVHSADYAVNILGSGSDAKGTDALPSIKYYDEMIAKSMLAMFINLGTTETGSRALGGSFIKVFLDSVQACADYIAEVISRFLIKEWVNYNWTVKEYPALKVSRIEKLDPTVLAQLKKAGVITADIGIENAVRKELHLPEKQEEEVEEIVEPSEIEEEEELSEHKQGLKFADRDYTEEEELADIPMIEFRLDNAKKSLEQEILELRDNQLNDMVMQLIAGKKIQDVRIILKKDMYSLLIKEFKRQVKQGRKEVAEEIHNQIGKAADQFADAPIDYDEYLELIGEQLSIDIEGAGNKLKSMLAGLVLEYKKLGLRGDALREKVLEKAPGKISDITWKDLASGVVNQGWGAGRDLESQKYEDQIDYVYRSAILDGYVCAVCRGKDGDHHEINDRNYIAPDPECEGTEKRCRCMNIFVMKSESASEEEYDAFK